MAYETFFATRAERRAGPRAQLAGPIPAGARQVVDMLMEQTPGPPSWAEVPAERLVAARLHFPRWRPRMLTSWKDLTGRLRQRQE